MVEDTASLDGLYAAFGKVLEGMDTVDEIVNTEVIRRDIDSNITTIEEYYAQYMEIDRPVNPPKIKTITVDSFGVTYEAPTKLK
jgi:peptidyl-prolyl cis-trans isomerase B (cyclophilin B)